MDQSQPHVVCVPFPAQGHIIPMIQLAKLFRSKGFFVTFVNTEHNHRRLIKTKGPSFVEGFEGFRFETITDGLPPSDRNSMQDVPSLCDSTRKNCLAPFRALLGMINDPRGGKGPPVSCVITDGVMTFALEAAAELKVPGVVFWTASACGFMGYLQYSEIVERGIFPFKDESFRSDGTLDTTVDWIPGMENICLRDIPSFIRTTDPNDIMFDFMGKEARRCLNSSAILFNTFDELEHKVLEAISAVSLPTYCVGPLSLLLRHLPDGPVSSFRPNMWKEDEGCIEWLDRREPNSVVYANYGSVTLLSNQQLEEFAWGLANSKRPFLWVIRPDIMMGESASLPRDFIQETEDRGFLTGWCPQDRVLGHPSVGAFLTHCGWNSTLEAICTGVPIICWPWFAEQQTNCRYACGTEWGIGVEIGEDVKRSEIERLVRESLSGERVKKGNAEKWKRKAIEATDHGGMSYNDFDRFVKEVLHVM